MTLYRLTFKLVLERMEAERAHTLAALVLRAVDATPLLGRMVAWLLKPADPRLEVKALGLTFPSPLGVAAGMDKDAEMFQGLGKLGFGYVEVGTVTADAQVGNPKTRVWRLSKDRGLLNSMGSPNEGATVIGRRLARRASSAIVGVNVGKLKDTFVDDAAPDYRLAIKRLEGHYDYVVLNVSSPNTPGLRDLQSVAHLRDLITQVREELQSAGMQKPVLVKLAPDLSDDEIDAIADLALELELDGIIATNTTTDLTSITAAPPAEAGGHGGISGAPLKPRAVAVLERLRSRVGARLVLISVGGIETPDDAWERLLAGATLLQAHTGFVYGGPLWAHSVNRGLIKRLAATETAHLEEIIGTGAHSEEAHLGHSATGDAVTPSNAGWGNGVPVAAGARTATWATGRSN